MLLLGVKHIIFYYGENTYDFAAPDQMLPYWEFRKELCNNARSAPQKLLDNAVVEADKDWNSFTNNATDYEIVIPTLLKKSASNYWSQQPLKRKTSLLSVDPESPQKAVAIIPTRQVSKAPKFSSCTTPVSSSGSNCSDSSKSSKISKSSMPDPEDDGSLRIDDQSTEYHRVLSGI